MSEDKNEKYEEMQNIIECIHARLRPETFKSKEEIERNTKNSPNGEFEQLIRMGNNE